MNNYQFIKRNGLLMENNGIRPHNYKKITKEELELMKNAELINKDKMIKTIKQFLDVETGG